MALAKDLTLDDVLALIKTKRHSLDFEVDIPEGFRGHHAVIACILEHGNLQVHKLPPAALEDREILVLIMKKSGAAFESFPEWARDDEAIARRAVVSSYDAFRHASARLRGQRDFVLLAFSHHVSWDPLAAVTDEALKDDLDVLKAVVKGNPQGYGGIPERHRGRKELIDLVLSQRMMPNLCFDLLPAEYRDDKEIALKAVTDDAGCFEHLSERLRDDDELARAALKGRGHMLEFASARIQDDKAIVLQAVRDGDDTYAVLRCMSDRLKRDREVIVAAMEKDNLRLEQVDPSFRDDPEVIRACMKDRQYFHGGCYAWFGASFRADREIALRMSAGRDFPLEAAPPALRADREIARNAVTSRAANVQHLAPELANDAAFLKELHGLQSGILSHLSAERKAMLFATEVRTVAHRGRTVVVRLVLEDGSVENQQRAALSMEVRSGDRTVASMTNVPVITYEDDGPVGSYLSVRYVHNLVLAGDFVFFVQSNSGEETFTHSLSRAEQWNGYGPAPQTSDDFLKHSVYLVPESVSSIAYPDLTGCPRIHFGRAAHLPAGLQVFPGEQAYREALLVLRQQKVYGTPAFRRVDGSTLEAAAVEVAEIAGAPRVFVGRHGWRFLLPHPDGAAAALARLEATGDLEDWRWIQEHGGTPSAQQKKMLLEHFATVPFRAEVEAFCA